MTIEELKKLIENDEHRQLELKKTTGELKDGMHSACAFLNTDGGWLIFGVTSGSLRMVGQKVNDNTRREIAQALSGLEPAIDVPVDYIDVEGSDGLQLIALHFEGWVRGGVPYTFHGRPYYKVESTTKLMPRDMYEERLKEHNPFKFAWDSKVAEGYSISDLNQERIRGAVRMGIAGGRLNASAESDDIPTLLRKMQLLKKGQPTNAAVMLFGNNTEDYPQLLLRMACFKGTDKQIFIDNKRETGNFFDLLDAGIAFCFRHLNLSGEVVGLTRKEELEIPLEALREALINALCHRSYDDPASSVSLAIYDDRVEIVNPGKFPVGITAETILLPHESFPHNQRIAQVLYQTTYLENWGTGVRRMAEICRQQGKQSPTFEEGVRTITICFKKESRAHNVPKNVSINVPINVPKVIIEQLTERQRFIVDCIIHNASVSQTEMSQKAGVSRKTIQREIENMRFIGLKISREGSKKDGKWVFIIDD